MAKDKNGTEAKAKSPRDAVKGKLRSIYSAVRELRTNYPETVRVDGDTLKANDAARRDWLMRAQILSSDLLRTVQDVQKRAL